MTLMSTRAEEFEELRPLLFSIAYRILGSVSEAEDAVQDTWLRYEASPAQPTSAKAFLSAVVTRISINVLRSARARREEYVGPWFPELLLERLSPLERAVFRAAGGVRVRVPRGRGGGGTVGGGVPPARGAGAPSHGRRPARGRREREELAGLFFDAFTEGDLDGLRELLAADVHMVGDGGGKAPQWGTGVIAGAQNVARVLAALIPPFAQIGVVEARQVNGQPGAIFRDRDGRVINTWTLDILDGQIQTIRTVINPDKLGRGPGGRRPGGAPRGVPGAPPCRVTNEDVLSHRR